MPQFVCPFELKSITERGQFEGFAAVYSVIDELEDVVEPGAFERTLREGRELSLYWEHKEVIGTVELRDSPSALLVKGKLSLGVQRADEALILLRDRAVKGLSIGFKTIRSDFVGAVRHLKELRLWEISLTGLPANQQSVVTAVKNLDHARIQFALKDFRDDILRALGRK